jgi:pantoate--beta-alanine ligase
MQIFDKINDLKSALKPYKAKYKVIGFVPTMGALHNGHISLVETSLKKNDVTIVSIYVNPTQFNDINDLKNYPRNFQQDFNMLEKIGCQIVFTPTDHEMYPEPDNRVFDFGNMANMMEGKHRPGHFNGVAQIVTKLFDAVQPDNAYFGQKDFQQLSIIQKIVKDLNYPINIEACPIVREPDGLAMSSRNMLLGANERQAAPLINKTLLEARNMINTINLSEIASFVEQSINHNQFLKLEYFEAVNTHTLQQVKEITGNEPVTACIAVFAGKIRLIDNIEFIS